MYKCDNCDYKSARMWCINRHSLNRHGTNHIKEQSTQIQYGLGSVVNSTTHIPIEKYKEVCDATNQWKIYYEKLQKEHTLLQEHRREEEGYLLERINYLQNLLNNYNINYEKYE